MRRELSDDPDPIDVAVGQRVRLRRKALKMSQTRLADSLGVTFQQVQKYEKGANRISASALVRIANSLGCPVSALLGETAQNSAAEPLLQLLTVPGAEELLRAYVTVQTPETRRAILTIARELVKDRDAAPDKTEAA